METKDKLIERLLQEKAEKNNKIDLNAYAFGLDAMYEALSKDNDNTRYLILSGEGNMNTEHQFCMECTTLKEANEQFDSFKSGQFKETNLFIYEAKKIRQE